MGGRQPLVDEKDRQRRNSSPVWEYYSTDVRFLQEVKSTPAKEVSHKEHKDHTKVTKVFLIQSLKSV